MQLRLTLPAESGQGVGRGAAAGCVCGIRLQAVRWPVSRVLFPQRGDGYSSSAAVTSRGERPTRTVAQDRACRARRRVSLHGLAPDGVYPAQPVASLAVRFYRTFSPLPACLRWDAQAVCFLRHFPWGRPRRVLPGILILWSPDFPLPPDFSFGGSGHPAI